MMNINEVQAIIHPLLRKHRGEIPIASLLYCLEAELNVTLQRNERGVSLEHLVSAVPAVEIKYNDYGIKILSWHEDNTIEGELIKKSR
jgi:meiosis arrest female protein 1